MKSAYLFSFLVLIIFLGILGIGLYQGNHQEIPSALIGQKLPVFNMPQLLQPEKTISDKDFKGKYALINVWATWCYACRAEHDFLMKINQQYHVPIYGIAYKDDADDARAWLDKYGNPYQVVGQDKDGNVAIDLGVYGTPETFVINPQGEIIYRYVGALTQQAWDAEIYPLLQKGAAL